MACRVFICTCRLLISLSLSLSLSLAVIVSKLLYGLEWIPFTEQDCARLDAFQYHGLRNIKHSFWSRVKNKDVLILANIRAKTSPKQQIIPLSQRLVHRQIKLYGHIIRAEYLDLVNIISMYQDGTRRKAWHRRMADPALNGTQSRVSAPSNTSSAKKLFLGFGKTTWETQNLITLLLEQQATEYSNDISDPEKVLFGGPVRGSYQATPSSHKVLFGGPVHGSYQATPSTFIHQFNLNSKAYPRNPQRLLLRLLFSTTTSSRSTSCTRLPSTSRVHTN